jgi:L-rhamnose isomerase / sugar isomerase
MAASQILKTAFRTDVDPILASARVQHGGAANPIAAYRKAGYRARVADIRPRVSGAGGGIV